MLDFIIVGLPRSGTTFAANLFTTEHSICWHDPVHDYLPSEMDVRKSSKTYRGISCTASWMWTKWFNSHPAKKIILERSIEEINSSMTELGMPTVENSDLKSFLLLEGRRVQFSDLFLQDKARDIWEYLLPALPFDAERHSELIKMNIQPVDKVQVPDAESIRRSLADLNSQLRG